MEDPGLTFHVIDYTDDLIKDVFQIRKKVFTEEQGIPVELDQDGNDKLAIHLLLKSNNKSVGTGRLTIKEEWAILSRIAVIKNYRGNQLAKNIIQKLEEIATDKGVNRFKLYPHERLESYYHNLGYKKDNYYKGEVAGQKLILMYKKKPF